MPDTAQAEGVSEQETTSPFEILEELLVVVREGNPTERNAAWARVQDPDVMDWLANNWREMNGRISVLLSTLETIPGQARRARTFRGAVRRLVEERDRRGAAGQFVDGIVDDLNRLTPLSHALDMGGPPATVVDPIVMSNLFVPRNYQIDVSGVYRVTAGIDGDIQRTKVCAAPMFISGRTVDVLTGEAKRQVVWRGPAGWCSRVVDRRTILDNGRIMSLADLEAPVSSITSGQVIGYLADFEAENSHRFPAIQSCSRMGWLPDGSFILPDVHYTPDQEPTNFALTPPPGLEQLAKGWNSAGTWNDWIEAIRMIQPYPYMMIAIYASAAAPLLTVLRLPGFVVDFSGETSGGKTTALRLSASVWGKPADSYPTAMYSWDATKVWIERTTGYLHNLPLILDETKRVRHPRMIRDVIYDFCQGQCRGRGSVDGTRSMSSWRSILISSGEGAATSFSQDAGTRARVLSLKGKPLGSDPEQGGKISEDVQMMLADNYGHLGRKVAHYLVSNSENHDQIRQVFKEARDRYSEMAQTAVARRHSAHLAVLEVAAQIVHQLGVPHCEEDPFAKLVESAAAAGKDADRPFSAMQDTVSWCAANTNKFWGRHEQSSFGVPKIPHSGWAGAWVNEEGWEFIAVTTLTLRQVLDDLGHHPDEVITRWDERGWLYRGTGRNRTRVIRIDGTPIRCYCLDRRAVDLAMED